MILSINSLSEVRTIPPSPQAMCLFVKNEKVATSPKLPHFLPLYSWPWACAASSIIFKLCFFAILIISTTSDGSPYICTITIAFVLFVINSSIFDVSTFQVFVSASAKTGFNLLYIQLCAAEIMLKDGMITSYTLDGTNQSQSTIDEINGTYFTSSTNTEEGKVALTNYVNSLGGSCNF